jgi:hypothetical protein
MPLLDCLLFPIYVAFFYLVFRAFRSRYEDPQLRIYHRNAFWIKVISSVAFTIFNVYLSIGDSTLLYHREGYNIYNLILKDSSYLDLLFSEGKQFDETLLYDRYNTGYFKSEANYLVAKLVALFSFVTLGKYLLINLIFSMIAFTGIWKLFLFFYEQHPKHHKKFAIAIIYMPTFIFWSSGILKDTLCVAALGWITYTLYEILFRKRSIFINGIFLAIAIYLLAIVKVYILISYVPVFVLFIILKGMAGVNNAFLKYTIAPVLLIVALFSFNKVLNSFDDELGAYAVKGITKSVKNLSNALEKTGAESTFSLGAEYDGTPAGLIKLAPFAVVATLFRPFLWEAHNASSLVAALESLMMICFTLMVIARAGLIRFCRLIMREPLIMYSFVFAMAFALFVGASTTNFGTLVRYKIPAMPFYLISIFLISEKAKELRAAKKPVEEPQLTPALS